MTRHRIKTALRGRRRGQGLSDPRAEPFIPPEPAEVWDRYMAALAEAFRATYEPFYPVMAVLAANMASYARSIERAFRITDFFEKINKIMQNPLD